VEFFLRRHGIAGKSHSIALSCTRATIGKPKSRGRQGRFRQYTFFPARRLRREKRIEPQRHRGTEIWRAASIAGLAVEGCLRAFSLLVAPPRWNARKKACRSRALCRGEARISVPLCLCGKSYFPPGAEPRRRRWWGTDAGSQQRNPRVRECVTGARLEALARAFNLHNVKEQLRGVCAASFTV
jgi:hypothetical protein